MCLVVGGEGLSVKTELIKGEIFVAPLETLPKTPHENYHRTTGHIYGVLYTVRTHPNES